MYVKSVEDQSPFVGMVWKLGKESYKLRCHPRRLTMIRSSEVHRQQPLDCHHLVGPVLPDEEKGYGNKARHRPNSTDDHTGPLLGDSGVQWEHDGDEAVTCDC
ncbi:hypothetical protein TNCV_705021 [Trichonephila clavipes]|nr:hypothetical protein TNCV_705021 [Trichonephila clavipes]